VLRFSTNTSGASFNALAALDDSLQVNMLLLVGSDIGVTAGEAIHGASAADGTCSSHMKMGNQDKKYELCYSTITTEIYQAYVLP